MTITMTSITTRDRILANIRQAAQDEREAINANDWTAWQRARLFRNRLEAALSTMVRGER